VSQIRMELCAGRLCVELLMTFAGLSSNQLYSFIIS
jgi:hypothetical protein